MLRTEKIVGERIVTEHIRWVITTESALLIEDFGDGYDLIFRCTREEYAKMRKEEVEAELNKIYRSRKASAESNRKSIPKETEMTAEEIMWETIEDPKIAIVKKLLKKLPHANYVVGACVGASLIQASKTTPMIDKKAEVESMLNTIGVRSHPVQQVWMKDIMASYNEYVTERNYW